MPISETTPEAFLNTENWRFVLMPDNSVRVLSRSPQQLTNTAMQALCAEHGLEIASSAEIRVAHTPFDQSGLRPEKAFRYPWGNETDLSDQSPLFRDQGISLGGLKRFGASRHGLWAVTRDGERLGGAYNIFHNRDGSGGSVEQGGERSDLGGERGNLGGDRGALGGERGNLAGERSDLGGTRSDLGGARGDLGGERSDLGGSRSDLGGERGNLKDSPIIRPAGFFARNAEGEPRPLELHENEAYFFSRAATTEEATYFHQAVQAIGEKLTADDGILILTPPDFATKKGYFAAGGGCHSCLRREGLTFQVQKNAIFNATGIEIDRLPEYKEELIAEAAKISFSMPETRALQGLLQIAQSGAMTPDLFATMREQVVASFPETEQAKLMDKLTRMLEQTPHLAQFLPVDVQPGQVRNEQRER